MTLNVRMLPGEYWWGGTTIHKLCPLTEESSYHYDFTVSAPNQTMPFYVSSLGRYIWSERPFKADAENGVLTLTGEEITLTRAGDSLKSAYLAAQAAHFPCDGAELPEAFFRTAQYNSWIQCAYYSSQEKVLAYAHGLIDHGYEPGVFIIDEGWHVHTDYGHWEFDFVRFPDPKAMVDELHALGFTVMLWIVPFVTAVGPRYFRSICPYPMVGTDPECVKHLYHRTSTGEVAIHTFWDGVSAILDMTNPLDEKFLDDQLQHLIRDYGVDGFKFDGGSLEAYAAENIINGVPAEGHDAMKCNIAWNEFGRRYAFHEYKDTFKGGGKNMIQRLHDRDHTWTGNGINELIPCAITKGLIGHPFTCPDMIGGGEWRNRFEPDFRVDEELFVRMAQCSALFPMMQFSWAPWEALNEENAKLCLDAAKLHVRMSDEILALVHSAEKTGEPILRCLEYNDPHQGYEAIDDEFMLGEDLLVAPVVTAGTRERPVTFPAGTWCDEEGHVFEGRQTVTLDAPLEKLLWFRRV